MDASALLASATADRPEWAVALADLNRRGPLRAPARLASEAGNVIHRKRPAGLGADRAERGLILERLLAPVDLVPTEAGLRRHAGELAEAHGLSFYDAEYLALAKRDEAALVTQDGKLAKVAAKVLGARRVLDLDNLRRHLSASAA